MYSAQYETLILNIAHCSMLTVSNIWHHIYIFNNNKLIYLIITKIHNYKSFCVKNVKHVDGLVSSVETFNVDSAISCENLREFARIFEIAHVSLTNRFIYNKEHGRYIVM